jgi:hypothetical protein
MLKFVCLFAVILIAHQSAATMQVYGAGHQQILSYGTGSYAQQQVYQRPITYRDLVNPGMHV